MNKHHKIVVQTSGSIPVPSDTLATPQAALPFVYELNLPPSTYSLINDADSNIANNLAVEALNIAGANINVFKLLGIYEQTKLIDLTGKGEPIASGSFNAFPASNAFDNTISEWRSIQLGPDNIVGCSYLGYDFGPIRLDNERVRYGINTSIKEHITTLNIQQGCDPQNRISKARIERSMDAKLWYGVDVISLPNTSDPVQYRIRQSAPARYWRIRPLAFNGGPTDFWAVVKLQLIDFNSLNFQDVQDELGFLENRDRAYSSTSLQIKAYYTIVDPMLEVGKFGGHISDTQTWLLEVAFSSCVQILGRALVIGDIIEVPSETQYTPGLKAVKKYLEVQDVAWATDGFTPGWVPTLQRITALPALATQETMAIFGSLNLPTNRNNYAHLTEKRFNIEALFLDQKVRAAANTEVPEKGEDIANIRQFSVDEIAQAEQQKPGIDLGRLNIDPRGIYVEDALPKNGEPFTEGPEFPPNPKNGDWHRQTYFQLPDPIPPILFLWSAQKGQWLWYEQDKRAKYNNVTNPTLESYIDNARRVPINKIGKSPIGTKVAPKHKKKK
jgi:hypothetical protein